MIHTPLKKKASESSGSCSKNIAPIKNLQQDFYSFLHSLWAWANAKNSVRLWDRNIQMKHWHLRFSGARILPQTTCRCSNWKRVEKILPADVGLFEVGSHADRLPVQLIGLLQPGVVGPDQICQVYVDVKVIGGHTCRVLLTRNNLITVEEKIYCCTKYEPDAFNTSTTYCFAGTDG